MTKHFKLFFLLFFGFSVAYAQDAGSVLGIPNATTSEIIAITGAQEGSLMYSNTENVLYMYNGSAWITMTADNLGNHFATQNIRTNGFWLSGDSDNEGFFIDSTGNVGVGTGAFTPERQFHVAGENGGIRLDRFGDDAFFFFVNKDASGANVIYNWALINNNDDNSFQIRNYGTEVGGLGLANTFVLKSNNQVQIPAYGLSTTFDDNSPAKLLGVTNDGSIVQTNTSAGGIAYEKIVIWAEEGGTLDTNSQEWSFGDSSTGRIGIPLPEDWEAYAVSFNADGNSATSTAQINVVNTVDNSVLFTINASAGGVANNMVYTEVLSTPVNIPAGTSLGFITVSDTGNVRDARVAVFLRRRP